MLTQRDLNRALLARQLLLERVHLPLPRAIERMGGIQAQYAPSAYLGLWSRVEGFQRQQLTRALEQKRVVQGTLLRGTIHIVSRRDYWPWAEAIRESGHEWLLRVRPEIMRRDLRSAERRLRAALRERPHRRDELIELIGKDAWLGVEIDLVRVPPSGTWERRRADLYALAEDWLEPNDVDVHDARELLVRRYLGAFGPGRVADIRSWARLSTEHVKEALKRIGPRRFHDEQGRELVDLPRAPLPDLETAAPARYIGTWEALLLVHARRTGVLPEEFRPRIFNTKLPFSMATFLLDGQVAGAWRYEQGRIQLEPFRKLTRAERRELDDEGERLAAFHV